MQFIPLVMAAVSTIGQISSAKAASQQANAQAQMARWDSEALSSSYNQKEEQQRRMARLQAGERRAAIAQSMTGLSGSNADVDQQSELFAELDALNIRYSGQSQRTDALNSAAMYEQSGKNAMTSGYFNAAGSILSGASSYYGGTMGGKTANSWG